jgi:hypothetical protein
MSEDVQAEKQAFLDPRVSTTSADVDADADADAKVVGGEGKASRANPFVEQLLLLMWKRKLELLSSKTEFFKTYMPPVLVFILLVLFKETLELEKVEEYLVPISFWVLLQKNVVAITYEKSVRLQEAMSMMVRGGGNWHLSFHTLSAYVTNNQKLTDALIVCVCMCVYVCA